MTRGVRLVTLAVLTSATTLVAGCTVGDEAAPALSGATTSQAASAPTGSGGPGADALSSEDISALLLDQGEAQVEREPVASVQVELELSPVADTVTLDVLAVVATATGTHLQMQVTAPSTSSPLGTTFSAEEFVDPEYLSDMELIDPSTGEALEVITAARGGRWCQCSVVPSRISPTPTPLQGTFPPLAEGTTTVDIRLGNFPVVEDVPVTE